MGAPNAAVLLTRSQRARQHVVEREYTRKQKKSKKVKERPGTAGNAPGALQIAQPIPVLMTAGKPRLIKGFGEALSESGNLNAFMDIAISSADVFNAIVNRPPGPMDIVYRAADDSIDRRIKEGFDKIGPKTIGLNVISTEIVPENDEAPTLTTFVSPVPEHPEALTSPLTTVVFLSPVPEHPEALTSPLTTVVTAPTNITDKFTRTTREFLWIIKEKRPKALVAQPSNVRVEATSNSSAVIQWDYESETQIDGFVVRYMHEPGGKSDTDKWHSRTVMSPSARYLVINQLNAHKPYAFCVLAISQNRQGSCSDPWTTIERLQPIYMVTNLAISWKTDSSAMVKWEYNGPQPVKFFLNSTGKKEYMDHNLELKRIMSPGYRVEVDGSKREHLFTSFRPHTRYTIHVGVETLPPGAREYWPAEITVQTNPRAPPMVATPVIAPTFTDLSTGQAVVTFFPASEEYGEISHYFVIVVPQNVTWAHPNDDPLELERVTKLKAARLSQGVSVQPARKRKRERDRDSAAEVQEEIEELEGLPVKRSRKDISPNPLLKNLPNKSSPSNRRRRSPPLPQTNVPATNGAYITARINAERMREMYRAKEQFVIGDGQKYSNYVNFKLDEAEHFRVVMRAYANSGRDFGGAPMGDRGTKLYADSLPSEPFVPKGGSGRPPSPAGSMWLLGPIIVLVCIGLLIGMLVCWWLRCNKKSVGRGNSLRHSSITKVALGTHHLNGNGNGTAIVSETSKLLGNDYGRAPIMHPYEQMNGNAESSLDHLYPLPSSAQRSHVVAPNGNVPGYVPCLPSSGGVIGGLSLSHPPVPITELAAHIEKLRANNNAGFIQEFESMEVGQQFTWDASSSEYNKHKNRYANVVAYDHSRVILTSVDGIPGSDYVNANYIDGYDRPRAYIATQGPLPETFDDFWRMVWEESSMTIVMLTNLEENSRTKCDQYWPSRGTAHYGDVEVSLVEVTVLAHYTMRTFRLSIEGEGEAREVRHFQYTAWPDHGVPDHPTPFLMFLKRVKTLNPPDAGPIISHCSAGIGRTGAFIVIDCMLERLRYEHTVDIFGCVQALRAQRTYMVQIDDQYMFIHDAILDAVLSGSTEVPARRLHQHVTALIQIPPMESLSALEQEFRQLNNFRLLNARCADANLPVNRHKNRRMDVIPYDSNRVLLHHVPGVEGSDYINASWIDGYRERCAYIATQAPGESTIVDFWRMVWEHDAGIIVVLKMSYDGTMGREHSQSRLEYWPSEQGVQVGQLVVEPIAEYNMPQYILREFKISDLQTKMSRTLRHFEYIDWPELSAAPKNAEMFIDFIQQVHRTKTQFGVDGPIVVHCATGASRTGVFIALAQIIDRIRLENVVDVFTTVKLLRTERQGMVTEKDQYQFLYLAAREYLNSYDAPL